MKKDQQSIYWPDTYLEKQKSAEDAVRLIRSGQRVFIGSSCGEPQYLVRTLVDNAAYFSDLEIIRLMSMESSPISLIANKSRGHKFNVRCIYQGSSATRTLATNRRFTTPMNLSAVSSLFTNRHLPINVALIQVSPPDDFGWLSLGVSVDITKPAAQSADLIIAQVNENMPRTQGRSIIHVNDVDVIVEHDEDLITVDENFNFGPGYTAIPLIAHLAANLIEDGSTIQSDLGITPQGLTIALAEKNDLGIHTQFLSDGIMDLVSRGVITNRYKGLNEGKTVGSTAVGSKNLYEFLNDNPSIELHPSHYVNNPGIIAQHNKMVSVSVGMNIDLIGQVGADALPYNHYSGVTGMLDFVRGTAQSKGGKSIILLPSTSIDGKISRILPELPSGGVVIPKGDVQYVISEFGAVNLFGKTLQERALAIISLAHPYFREELLEKAKEMNLMDRDRSLKEFLFGIYPAKMEETRQHGDHQVTFRAVKPVDDRRIQEHFYSMDQEDVASRFFCVRKSFFRDDMENMFQLDYVNRLTIVAITGEFGFGKIIGIGEYSKESEERAEVAFSVSSDWQGKGIAGVILHKLSEAARENGIKEIVAYTSPSNRGMIKLFKKLPYQVKSSYQDDMFVMTCGFVEKEPEETESKKTVK